MTNLVTERFRQKDYVTKEIDTKTLLKKIWTQIFGQKSFGKADLVTSMAKEFGTKIFGELAQFSAPRK